MVRYLDQHVIIAKCDARFINDERCDRGFTKARSFKLVVAKPINIPELIAAIETGFRVHGNILI